MKRKELRIGIAGVGRFGRLHLDVFQQLPGCSIRAIADTDAGTLKRVARKGKIENAYLDAMEMIRNPDLDAIDIVTDEATHARLIIAALNNGKSVFVEKPLATSSADALKIEKLAEKTGLMVMVGNISRFSQPYISLKRRVAAGELGRVGIIRAKRDFSRFWFKFFGKRIHTVYESGIHDIDLILWLAKGKCVSVFAAENRISGNRHPDIFSAILKFDDGLIATIGSAWMLPAAAPQNLVETLELDGTIDADLEVVGTKGCARVKLLDSGLSVWTDRKRLQPEMTLWTTEHDCTGGAIRAELQHFVKQALVGRKSAVAPLQDSVEALRIADAIVKSARQNCVVKLTGEI